MIVITTVYEFSIDNICYLLLELSIINNDRACVIEKGIQKHLKNCNAYSFHTYTVKY